MAKRGRPTKFKPEFVDQVRKLALIGATDEQIADFFGIAVTTLHTWVERHPTFSEARKSGKADIDAQVEQSLFRRATGYSHPAVKIMQYEGNVIETPYIEHYPPDATSMIFWLKNRQPQRWRDKTESTVSLSLESLIAASQKRKPEEAS